MSVTETMLSLNKKNRLKKTGCVSSEKAVSDQLVGMVIKYM